MSFFGNRVLVLRPLWTKAYQTFWARALIMPGICSNPMTSVLVLPLFYSPSKIGRDELSKLLIHSSMVGLPAFLALLLTEIEVSENLRKWELRKYEQLPQLGLATEKHWRAEWILSFPKNKNKKLDFFFSKLKLYCFKFISHLENTSLLQISCCVIPKVASQP